ncbi:MAG: ABC transporter ATP-binding protein [Chloroflexi bacterium]|nr:ABC transporter ATP-binding protein [Chloroflexota bacterium]
MDHVIETHNLTKIYGDKYIALNGANLAVPQGGIFGLVGPNGAGKTTTIRMLLGLHKPTAGSVLLFGEPMTPNAVHLRRRIGFLPTNPRFPKEMTPIGYLDFVGKISGLPSEVRKPRLAMLLRAVGLLSAASQKVKGFSTGMTTRLGIAASLMNDPDLLIWDEPTAGLDPEGHKYTLDLIRELGETKTILVSSHNLADIKRICSHIAILSDGRLIFSGTMRDMRSLTRSSALELELDGDPERLRAALTSSAISLRWELDRQSLKLYFSHDEPMAVGLSQVLQCIVAADARLLAVNSLHDEVVDAFIHLLEEERSHGFSRILRLEPENHGVSGAAGS